MSEGGPYFGADWRLATVGEREEKTVPLYLSRFTYTPETWARMVANPEDRRKAAQSYIASVGGKLHGFWYAFGCGDGYNLWEAPDNVSMATYATGTCTSGGRCACASGKLVDHVLNKPVLPDVHNWRAMTS